MATDRKYTQGGATAVDGNYETDDGIGSRALRLICAKRGKWPGGRGRLLGGRFHELEKMDDDTVNELPGMVDEALEPLTETGEATDVEVTSEQDPNVDGALSFNADFTDRTTGDSIKHELPVGWQS
jgi:phage gp46-like protein